VVHGCTVNAPVVAQGCAVNEPKDGEDGINRDALNIKVETFSP
jgi:hypothetical protein